MKCHICKSKDVKVLYRLKEFDVYKCKNCRLRFSLLPEKHEYEEEYFTKEQKPYFNEINESKIKIFRAWLKEIEKYIEPGENKKILDVGCATGDFLNIAKESKWDCYGIDVSKYAVEQAKKLRINAKAAELDKAGFKEDYFNVVFMSFMIEHAENPVEIVDEVRRILKKDGILFISTINEDSLLNKFADFIYKTSLGLIKKPVELLHPHQHLTHFSEKDLIGLLKKAGFEVLKTKKLDLPVENFQGGLVKDYVLRIFYFFQEILNKQYIVWVVARKKT